MWFRSRFNSLISQSQQRPIRHAKLAADRRHEARQLLLESLEDRRLMAFNVLADYDTVSNPGTLLLTRIDAGTQTDLVIPDYNSSSIGVRLGNADGTFGPLQSSAAGGNPQSVAAGDFTVDHVADLVVASWTGANLLAGNGNGTFAATQGISLPDQVAPGNPDPTPLAQHPLSVATGDINADGKLDLVVAADTYFTVKSDGYYGTYYTNVNNGYVNVLLGNGSGGFGPAETHALGESRYPRAAAVGDVNGDGHADVITANYGDLSVLLGNGTGAVADPITAGSGYPLSSISLGDVDGDGKIDTLLSSGGNLSVQKGDGTGHFTAQPGLSVDGNYINSAVMGDVNADGKLDLVGVYSLNQLHFTSYGYYGGYGGYYTSTRQAAVLIGNGLGGFASPLTSSLGSQDGSSYMTDVGLADLTGDGKPDVVAIDSNLGQAIVTTNDGNWNPPASIVISDATVVEGNSGTVNAVFTVTLIGSHGSVNVNFAMANNTAVAGSDYTSTSGTLTFGAGDSSKTISVPIIGDKLDEYDEQFFVNLSSAVGGVITDSQAVGTIQNDDGPPLVAINDVSKSEGTRGNTSFVFTVSLSAASGKYVSVNFATANGTATTADSDYSAASGTVTFSPGQTTQTITILVHGDKKKELNETFFVNLAGASNATIYDSQGVGTIVNDDGGSGSGGGGKGHANTSILAGSLLPDSTLTTTRKRK